MKIIKEKNLGTSEGKKNTVSKKMGKYNSLSPLEFSKLFLIVEAKLCLHSSKWGRVIVKKIIFQ